MIQENSFQSSASWIRYTKAWLSFLFGFAGMSLVICLALGIFTLRENHSGAEVGYLFFSVWMLILMLSGGYDILYLGSIISDREKIVVRALMKRRSIAWDAVIQAKITSGIYGGYGEAIALMDAEGNEFFIDMAALAPYPKVLLVWFGEEIQRRNIPLTY